MTTPYCPTPSHAEGEAVYWVDNKDLAPSSDEHRPSSRCRDVWYLYRKDYTRKMLTRSIDAILWNPRPELRQKEDAAVDAHLSLYYDGDYNELYEELDMPDTPPPPRRHHRHHRHRSRMSRRPRSPPSPPSPNQQHDSSDDATQDGDPLERELYSLRDKCLTYTHRVLHSQTESPATTTTTTSTSSTARRRSSRIRAMASDRGEADSGDTENAEHEHITRNKHILETSFLYNNPYFSSSNPSMPFPMWSYTAFMALFTDVSKLLLEYETQLSNAIEATTEAFYPVRGQDQRFKQRVASLYINRVRKHNRSFVLNAPSLMIAFIGQINLRGVDMTAVRKSNEFYMHFLRTGELVYDTGLVLPPECRGKAESLQFDIISTAAQEVCRALLIDLVDALRLDLRAAGDGLTDLVAMLLRAELGAEGPRRVRSVLDSDDLGHLTAAFEVQFKDSAKRIIDAAFVDMTPGGRDKAPTPDDVPGPWSKSTDALARFRNIRDVLARLTRSALVMLSRPKGPSRDTHVVEPSYPPRTETVIITSSATPSIPSASSAFTSTRPVPATVTSTTTAATVPRASPTESFRVPRQMLKFSFAVSEGGGANAAANARVTGAQREQLARGVPAVEALDVGWSLMRSREVAESRRKRHRSNPSSPQTSPTPVCVNALLPDRDDGGGNDTDNVVVRASEPLLDSIDDVQRAIAVGGLLPSCSTSDGSIEWPQLDVSAFESSLHEFQYVGCEGGGSGGGGEYGGAHNPLSPPLMTSPGGFGGGGGDSMLSWDTPFDCDSMDLNKPT